MAAAMASSLWPPGAISLSWKTMAAATADPRPGGGEPAGQVRNAPDAGAVEAQPRLLNGVVRVLGVRAEHAERDRAQVRAVALEIGGELFYFCHPHPRRGVVRQPALRRRRTGGAGAHRGRDPARRPARRGHRRDLGHGREALRRAATRSPGANGGVSNFFNRINTTLRVPPGTPYN